MMAPMQVDPIPMPAGESELPPGRPRRSDTPLTPLDQIEAAIESCAAEPVPARAASNLLALSEAVLEHWVLGRGAIPTHEAREGFRLLALHRQGARDLPSFNACRETCREIAWHYNLLGLEAPADQHQRTVRMMVMLAKHLLFFVSGKMQVEGLGEFCCSSRPLRTATQTAE